MLIDDVHFSTIEPKSETIKACSSKQARKYTTPLSATRKAIVIIEIGKRRKMVKDYVTTERFVVIHTSEKSEPIYLYTRDHASPAQVIGLDFAAVIKNHITAL